MILIFVEMVLGSAADVEAARTATAEVTRHTKLEAGCLHYSFASDLQEPLIVRVAEQWESEAALKSHMVTPHLQKFMAAMQGIDVRSMSATMFDGTNQRDPAALLQETVG